MTGSTLDIRSDSLNKIHKKNLLKMVSHSSFQTNQINNIEESSSGIEEHPVSSSNARGKALDLECHRDRSVLVDLED